MRLTFLAGLGLLAACTAPPSADPDAGTPPPPLKIEGRSGSRLRIRYLEAAGTGRVPVGFFDKSLGVPCTFVEAGDGSLRCMPPDRRIEPGGSFADPDCMIPLLEDRADPACLEGPARFLVTSFGTSSSGFLGRSGRQARRISRRNDAPHYRKTGLACGLVDQTGSGSFYSVGNVVAPDTFVKGRTELRRISSQLGLVETIGEDGSRIALHFVDLKRDTWCVPRFANAGLPPQETACLPYHATPSDFFADPACIRQLASAFRAEPAHLVLTSKGETLRLGAKHDGRRFSLSAKGCMVANPSQDLSHLAFWEMGPPLDADSLVWLTMTSSGEGRLRRLDVEHEGQPTWAGLLVNQARHFDTATGSFCMPAATGPAGLRCLPLGMPLVHEADFRFVDPACQNHVVLPPRNVGYDQPFLVPQGSRCANGDHAWWLHKLGKQLPMGIPIYRWQPALSDPGPHTCVPSGPLQSGFGLSPPEPWDAYAPLTEAVDDSPPMPLP